MHLSLPGKDLGHQFGIHPSTLSRIFYNVLNVLFNRLKCFIVWPNQDTLRQDTSNGLQEILPFMYMQSSFIVSKFSLTDLRLTCQTYLHYKNHNTAKYLIGSIPQGSICLISNGWGGRVSDKFITENCGISNKINPGDTAILADHTQSYKYNNNHL